MEQRLVSHARLHPPGVEWLGHPVFSAGNREGTSNAYLFGGVKGKRLHQAQMKDTRQGSAQRFTPCILAALVITNLCPMLHFIADQRFLGAFCRDLKPENILFTRTLGLKLCDFGLAIDLRDERAVTRAGTLEYMAPEVRADV